MAKTYKKKDLVGWDSVCSFVKSFGRIVAVMVAIELLCARKFNLKKCKVMKLFKQSFQAKIVDGVLECDILLGNVKRISFKDIARLTNGILPYAIIFRYTDGTKGCSFEYYQSDGVYKTQDAKTIRMPYDKAITSRVTLCGHSQECTTDFGEVDVINTKPDNIVLYGVKSTFESNKESAVCTHKITISPDGYKVVGLGKDRYCRVLDKANEYYGKLFSDVEDKDALLAYYWRYRKYRCIDMDALASALGRSKMGGTSWIYEPKYICED